MRQTPAAAALLALAPFAFDAAAEPIRLRAIRDRVEREAGPTTTRYIAAAGDIACERGPNGPASPTLCHA